VQGYAFTVLHFHVRAGVKIPLYNDATLLTWLLHDSEVIVGEVTVENDNEDIAIKKTCTTCFRMHLKTIKCCVGAAGY
jgi:hypothetical protein